MKVRCAWAGDDPAMTVYHDREWGVPQHDDRALFELLILEGAQAGLSWSTILRKREAYRAAYREFDPAAVARFDARKQSALLRNPGIVRNTSKIAWSVRNARALTLPMYVIRGSCTFIAEIRLLRRSATGCNKGQCDITGTCRRTFERVSYG